jgi:hypothetical protein
MVVTGARRNEITIALLGLVGIIAVAVVSNWDKMFPKTGVIQAVYSRYKPTGNFETELRYYLEVSGAPKLSAAHEELMTQYENILIAQHPGDWNQIHNALAKAEEQTGRDWDQLALPIYEKYYTIEELQELNKLYSTKIVRKMVKKSRLISQELSLIRGEQFQELQVKLLSNLEGAQE